MLEARVSRQAGGSSSNLHFLIMEKKVNFIKLGWTRLGKLLFLGGTYGA